MYHSEVVTLVTGTQSEKTAARIMTVDTNTEAQQHLNGQTCPLRINIIGAGIAGLTLGTILRKNKHEVHVRQAKHSGDFLLTLR